MDLTFYFGTRLNRWQFVTTHTYRGAELKALYGYWSLAFDYAVSAKLVVGTHASSEISHQDQQPLLPSRLCYPRGRVARLRTSLVKSTGEGRRIHPIRVLLHHF